MDSLSVLVPIVSLLAGWFLNEMSKKYQMGRERRARIGRALSNLLELHHQIRTVENYINVVRDKFNLPKDHESMLRAQFAHMLPQSDEFVKRYEEAVEQLSESDPLAAFNLRSRAQIPRFIASIKSMSELQGSSDSEVAVIERMLKEMLIPHLEQAIRELASLYGKSTLRRVSRMLDSPSDMSIFLDELMQKAEATQQQQLAGGG